MGTLKKLKFRMKLDREWRRTLVRGTKNEILIDLDGDKQADLALMDTLGDGDVDTLAIDLDGNGDFDLYFVDTDHNNIPDKILFDEKGDGEFVEIASGKEVEEGVILALQAVETALAMGDYIAASLDAALDELEKEIKAARKKLKA